MELRNWEFSTAGSAIVGADVYVYEASLAHPNANAILSSTTTNSDGMWAFTGLTDTAKDVKVVYQSKTKWYKGLTKHSVGIVFIDEYPTADFAQVIGQASVAAPSAGIGRLYMKTDGRVYRQYGSAGEVKQGDAPQITTATGVTSAPTTTSASDVDIPDLSATWTARGGIVLGILTMTHQNDTAGAIHTFGMNLDGGANQLNRNWQHNAANSNKILTMVHSFGALPAGSHTIKGRWATTAGTATTPATQRSLTVIEFGN